MIQGMSILTEIVSLEHLFEESKYYSYCWCDILGEDEDQDNQHLKSDLKTISICLLSLTDQFCRLDDRKYIVYFLSWKLVSLLNHIQDYFLALCSIFSSSLFILFNNIKLLLDLSTSIRPISPLGMAYRLCVNHIKSEVAQLCLTLWDPMDHSLPRSSVHGIFQARVLVWVATSFSRVVTLSLILKKDHKNK